ncbi:hypothetical protein [Streptomyces tendae]|uniref:hypothetical protein n=1 Tax=Streptomyces tendae TaxID=1932 RepID=UPI003713047F
MYAYGGTNCTGLLGSYAGWHFNWGDRIGNYQTSVTNYASSILNKDTTQEFQFFSSGATVNNAIGSHRWVVYIAGDSNWAEWRRISDPHGTWGASISART